MKAKNFIVAVSVFAAAGMAMAGDADRFTDNAPRVLVQASEGSSYTGMQMAGRGYSYTELERGAQVGAVAPAGIVSMKSRAQVHEEAVQAAKDRMVKGVHLLPGDGGY